MFLLMMADRHKRRHRSVRLPEDLEQQVDAMAAERGVGFNTVVVEAVRAYLDGRTARKIEPIHMEPKTVGYSKERQARGKR